MKVEWSATPGRAVQQIFAYIAEHNPTAAERIADEILAAGESLHNLPQRYPDRGSGSRQMRIDSTRYVLRYRLAYDPGKVSSVRIVTVRHGARQG